MLDHTGAAFDNSLYRLDKKRHNRFKYRYKLSAYLMIAPAFILLSIFVIWPLIWAIVRSFQEYSTSNFVGLSNYLYIFQTDIFMRSIGNVLLLTLIITVLMTVLSFLFALALKSLANKFGGLAKIIMLIPFFISGIAASIIFTLITNYGGGLITSILVSMDMDPVSFQTDQVLAYVAIIIPSLWLGFGYNTLLMYSGLINIPSDYYSAAKIDGANWLQTTFRITMPAMKNTFVLIVVNLVTANMQMMEIPLIMTQGGPLNSTLTPVLYLYNSYRDPAMDINSTIAGALIVMIFIMTVNILVFKFIRSKRSEDV